MSARPDPRWLPVAEQAFSALLYLYPPALRREHGDEMLQAFRDRCREAGAVQSPASVLLLELLPDTVHGIADAHWHEGAGETRRWHLLAMALLLLAAGWLLFQGPLSAKLLDWQFQAKYAIQNARQAREMAAEEAQVAELAGLLANEESVASKAQAAYLYRGLYDARLTTFFIYGASEIEDAEARYGALRDVLPAFGEAAWQTSTASFQEGQSPWIAVAATHACLSENGCDRGLAISRLIAREPRNAYGWSLAFKEASLAQDQRGMRRALAGMAAASSFEDHLGDIRAAIFASSARLLPQDEDARAIVAKRVAGSRWIDTTEFRHDVRLQCALRSTELAPRPAPATWAESHPDSEADCLHIALLLAQSGSPFNVLRGQALLAQRDAGPVRKAGLERARQFFNDSRSDLGVTHLGDDRHWLPWTSAEWNRWASFWKPGESEISVTRNWNARPLD
jgi:hypothetical protein